MDPYLDQFKIVVLVWKYHGNYSFLIDPYLIQFKNGEFLRHFQLWAQNKHFELDHNVCLRQVLLDWTQSHIGQDYVQGVFVFKHL